MKLAVAKTATAAAALLLALAACSENAGSGDDSTGDGGEDPVFAAMKTWDACEVLDNLQPITDYMGIEGYGSSTTVGGEPATRAYDTTWYPDAIGCGNLINLGDYEGFGGGGEIGVAIVPAENEDQASSLFEERTSAAESAGSSNEGFAETALTDAWDEGALYAWTGSADASWLELVARDGQWVLHIKLNYDQDFGITAGGEPAYAFTNEELNQWLVETYAPEANQTVNDKIAEVQ